ncbi:MAG TPA: ATP-binding protein [Longimicrobiales bacterium]|nr:ATP-binding protein [Longimicrobiales bacterium]
MAAGILVAAALALSILLRDQITRTVFVFFFAAITVTAWYSGLVPGLTSAFASLLATNYFLVEPRGQLHFNQEMFVMFIVLGSTAAFISWLTDTLAETRATLAVHADQLEEQARELELRMEESQKLSEDLAETAKHAQAASQAKTDFMAVMSHELRTPLNAIVGYADLLQTGVSGPLTEAQKTQLTRIRSSSFHLLDLIQDVLSFSRIEAGREELRLGEVDVQRLARDVHDYIEQQCAAKGLDERLTIPPEPLVMVTDSAKVKQILLNLLTNACKFTDAGHVELAVQRDHDDIVFSVSDTGPGIAPEHLQMIFEPFTQVDQSRTREKGGAGLGLPVSRRLAHLLGGELQVQSTQGAGSTFTLRLPIHARLR